MIAKSVGLLLALVAVALPQAAPAHIVILSPNGGEVYTAGEVVQIRWCIAVAHSLQNWDIRYNPALPGVNTACGNVTGGFTEIALDVPPTCTAAGGGICFLNPDPPCCMDYFWTVPDGIDSDQVKIKIKMDNSGTDYFDLSDAPFTITSSTSSPLVADGATFVLEQNEPNPFAAATRISFSLERESPSVRLTVHDVRGALVKTLVLEGKPAGRHAVTWEGVDETGGPVGSGIYFYRLQDQGRVETRKMILAR